MEVKIQIPDNCELIKNGDTYIVKEKKNDKPRSWEEFCDNYPLKDDCFIRNNSSIESAKALGIVGDCRHVIEGVNWITSKEEAEAFLALMQLRQLRRAWVGDWNPSGNDYYAIIFSIETGLKIGEYANTYRTISFPTPEMTEDFLNCFKSLCETAKILL